MQPQYVLKVDEIRHIDAPPFTTTPASIPTLFIVNVFGICAHMHLQSSRSTVVWRCILKLYALSVRFINPLNPVF